MKAQGFGMGMGMGGGGFLIGLIIAIGILIGAAYFQAGNLNGAIELILNLITSNPVLFGLLFVGGIIGGYMLKGQMMGGMMGGGGMLLPLIISLAIPFAGAYFLLGDINTLINTLLANPIIYGAIYFAGLIFGYNMRQF